MPLRPQGIATLALGLAASLAPAAAMPLFNVPSTSMMPTLEAEEVILALALTAPLQRGDIVVYGQRGQSWLGRIIAFGGETVELRHGEILIDGAALPQTRLANPIAHGCPSFLTPEATCTFLRETMPEGRSYVIIDSQADSLVDTMAPRTVPENNVFIVADNRDTAVDSRLPQHSMVTTTAILGIVHNVVVSAHLGSAAERVAGFPQAR